MFGSNWDPMSIIGGTPFNADAYNLGIPAEALMQQAQQQAAPKKGGLFGKSSILWDIIGGFGDAVTGKPVYTNAAQQHREGRQKEQDYQRRRQDQLEDWKAQKQWERDNPAPLNNDTVADYKFWESVLPPGQFKQYIANKVNPPRWGMLPNGQWGLMGGGPTASPVLTDDDIMRMEGGAGQAAPRTFP